MPVEGQDPRGKEELGRGTELLVLPIGKESSLAQKDSSPMAGWTIVSNCPACHGAEARSSDAGGATGECNLGLGLFMPEGLLHLRSPAVSTGVLKGSSCT